MKVWVDDSSPEEDSQINVFGSLIKNDVPIGGIVMYAVWPDGMDDDGISSCDSLVTYGKGVCSVKVTGYAPGVFVPITVTFRYQGETYSGATGFTPELSPEHPST